MHGAARLQRRIESVGHVDKKQFLGAPEKKITLFAVGAAGPYRGEFLESAENGLAESELLLRSFSPPRVGEYPLASAGGVLITARHLKIHAGKKITQRAVKTRLGQFDLLGVQSDILAALQGKLIGPMQC